MPLTTSLPNSTQTWPTSAIAGIYLSNRVYSGPWRVPSRTHRLYDATSDRYTCSQGKHLLFDKVFVDAQGNPQKRYIAKASKCKVCPLAAQCKGQKAREKRLHHTRRFRWWPVEQSWDPATAAELRQLRAANRRQAQALEIVKKAIASKRFRRVISQTPDQ